jgi:hypothetical protein
MLFFEPVTGLRDLDPYTQPNSGTILLQESPATAEQDPHPGDIKLVSRVVPKFGDSES